MQAVRMIILGSLLCLGAMSCQKQGQVQRIPYTAKDHYYEEYHRSSPIEESSE